MLEHISRETAERYRRGRLEPAALLALDRHIVHCLPCRRTLAEACQADAMFLSLQQAVSGTAGAPSPHLDSRLLAEFVDGRLDDQDAETSRTHAGSCPVCLAAVVDLAIFRTEVAPGLDRRHEPRA